MISKEWCLRMAQQETGEEIGAGALDHPLRCAPDEIEKRRYAPPIIGADWTVSAADLIAVTLSIALGQRVPGWPGATDEQLEAVANEVIAALDGRPMAQAAETLQKR